MESAARVVVPQEATRLGRYDLGRELGSGGMGSVVEATHRALGKRVAIKRFHPHLATRPESLARFVREGRAIAGLRHPNIVEVFDLDWTETGVPYLVMELLEGSTLAARLARAKPLSLAEAVGMALPLASALGAAHAAGIVHRDVKPSNIFLRAGALSDPCLVDFGVSKHAANVAVEELTQSGTLVGSYPYFSPEHTRGAKHVTPQSDLYSLAAVLYECTTGALPFDGESAYALMHTIATQDVLPPSAVRADLPREFDEILLRAMDRDPRHRYATLRSFASALLRFADKRTWHAWSHELIGDASARPALERTVAEDLPTDAAPARARRKRSVARLDKRLVLPAVVLASAATYAFFLGRPLRSVAPANPPDTLPAATASFDISAAPSPKVLQAEEAAIVGDIHASAERRLLATSARHDGDAEATRTPLEPTRRDRPRVRPALTPPAERGSNGVPILE